MRARGASRVVPPIPGRILSVKVREGDRVQRGEVLATLGAMEMQNEIASARAGWVRSVRAEEGEVLDTDAILFEREKPHGKAKWLYHLTYPPRFFRSSYQRRSSRLEPVA